MTLIRAELVEASVMRCIVTGLPDYGYTLADDSTTTPPTTADVFVREAFPTAEERNGELTVTTLAFGFNIDDGGEPAELGSTLTKYVHTLVCWTFATEPQFGRRLANVIKDVVRRSYDQIPLLDFDQDDDPQIDSMIVMKAQARHEVNVSPRPWDRYVWTTAISVRDVAYPDPGNHA